MSAETKRLAAAETLRKATTELREVPWKFHNAVADMLDHTAEVIEQTDLAQQVDRRLSPVPWARVEKALAVANAYLREPGGKA